MQEKYGNKGKKLCIAFEGVQYLEKFLDGCRRMLGECSLGSVSWYWYTDIRLGYSNC